MSPFGGIADMARMCFRCPLMTHNGHSLLLNCCPPSPQPQRALHGCFSMGLAAVLPHPPKVIIFDFDGVILDSANIKLRAYSAIYSGEDPKKLTALIAHSQLHGGITRRIKFEYYEREFFGRNGDPASVEALCQRYSDIVFKAVLVCPFIE